MKLLHRPLIGGLLRLVQRRQRGLDGASVPITVLLYNGSLLCGFDVPVKRVNCFEVLKPIISKIN